MRVGQPNPRNWRNVPRKPRYIWLLATRQLARKRQRSLMSLLITSPATVAAAATHLAGIGSALSTANAAAAAPTTALSVAGADEVSVLIAALFEAYAQEYQALSAQALAFHDQFVQALNMGAVCYAADQSSATVPTGYRTPGKTVGPAGCCSATVATADPAGWIRPVVTAVQPA